MHAVPGLDQHQQYLGGNPQRYRCHAATGVPVPLTYEPTFSLWNTQSSAARVHQYD